MALLQHPRIAAGGLFLLSMLLSPLSVAAAASVASPSTQAGTRLMTGNPSFSGSSLLQLVFGLVMVIGLILLLAWAARRIGNVAGISHSGLKVVATLPLTPRERVVLVQAGDQQLLLGVAPGRVNLLQSYATPLIDPQKTPGNQFADRLREALHRSRG